MKFAFFGTPRFAHIVLETLIKKGMAPAAVVTNPDRPVGRKQVITPPPTKELSSKYEILVFQPEKVHHLESELKKLDCDFFVVAAYAQIIPKSILEIPRLGSIGVHPSLLPRLRGSSPIQSALLERAGETGVTLYLLDQKMDHGPILAQAACPIEPKDTYLTLQEKLAKTGGELLVQTIPEFLKGSLKLQDQNESQATYTTKFAASDAFIDPADLGQAILGSDPELALTIFAKIRAFNPEPGTWTTKEGKRLKILEAAVTDGRLRLLITQEEGGKPIRLS